MRRGGGLRGAGAALLVLCGMGTAGAGEAETALLLSFAGNWVGKGTLVEPDKTSPFDCKVTVSKGNRGKIVFRGQCPLITASGAVAFNDATGQYELALTSSTDFRAGAYGIGSADGIVFELDDSDTDRDNNTLTLSADLTMAKDKIVIVFTATLNDEPYSGDLTFTR